jgi:hypothetical protein
MDVNGIQRYWFGPCGPVVFKVCSPQSIIVYPNSDNGFNFKKDEFLNVRSPEISTSGCFILTIGHK